MKLAGFGRNCKGDCFLHFRHCGQTAGPCKNFRKIRFPLFSYVRNQPLELVRIAGSRTVRDDDDVRTAVTIAKVVSFELTGTETRVILSQTALIEHSVRDVSRDHENSVKHFLQEGY